jgi:hypothetical protein
MKKTQPQVLRDALKRRWYTSLEAAQKLGVWALSQRCGELRRQGVKVLDKWVTTETGKRIKAYRIA